MIFAVGVVMVMLGVPALVPVTVMAASMGWLVFAGRMILTVSPASKLASVVPITSSESIVKIVSPPTVVGAVGITLAYFPAADAILMVRESAVAALSGFVPSGTKNPAILKSLAMLS